MALPVIFLLIDLHVWNCQLDISGLQRGGQLFKMRFIVQSQCRPNVNECPSKHWHLKVQRQQTKKIKTIFVEIIVETICITAISANWHVLRNSGKLG